MKKILTLILITIFSILALYKNSFPISKIKVDAKVYVDVHYILKNTIYKALEDVKKESNPKEVLNLNKFSRFLNDIGILDINYIFYTIKAKENQFKVSYHISYKKTKSILSTLLNKENKILKTNKIKVKDNILLDISSTLNCKSLNKLIYILDSDFIKDNYYNTTILLLPIIKNLQKHAKDIKEFRFILASDKKDGSPNIYLILYGQTKEIKNIKILNKTVKLKSNVFLTKTKQLNIITNKKDLIKNIKISKNTNNKKYISKIYINISKLLKKFDNIKDKKLKDLTKELTKTNLSIKINIKKININEICININSNKNLLDKYIKIMSFISKEQIKQRILEYRYSKYDRICKKNLNFLYDKTIDYIKEKGYIPNKKEFYQNIYLRYKNKLYKNPYFIDKYVKITDKFNPGDINYIIEKDKDKIIKFNLIFYSKIGKDININNEVYKNIGDIKSFKLK